jgi:hypothetical protein
LKTVVNRAGVEETDGRSRGIKICGIFHGKGEPSWFTEVGWRGVLVRCAAGAVEGGNGGGGSRGCPAVKEVEGGLVPKLMVQNFSSECRGVKGSTPR